MLTSSNAPPITTTEGSLARLQALMQQLTIAIQELRSYLESIPGEPAIETLLINLGEKHAVRTSNLLDNVPNSPDGLLSAVNLVQTYLQVTEFLTQAFLTEILQLLGQEQGTATAQKYIGARQTLDQTLVDILSALKQAPSIPLRTTTRTINPAIEELIEDSENILKVINSDVLATEKVTRFIQYLGQDVEPVLKSDGLALTDAQINLLLDLWSAATANLPTLIPRTEEERKQFVTQVLIIRRLLENIYDLVAEILRFKDPLGFRTP